MARSTSYRNRLHPPPPSSTRVSHLHPNGKNRMSALARPTPLARPKRPTPPRSSSTRAIFEERCTQIFQHGWPVFNTSQSLSDDQRWSAYFHLVYGELPETPGPFCVSDLWTIYWNAFVAAGLNDTRLVPMTKFSPQHHANFTAQNTIPAGRLFILIPIGNWWAYYHCVGICHAQRPVIRSNMWVEVMHRRKDGSESNGMWLSYARGSGIWFWTGSFRDIRSNNQGQELCGANFSYTQPPAAFPRSKTYDWVEEVVRCASRKGLGSFGGLDTTYENMYEIAYIGGSGSNACGTRRNGIVRLSRFRMGWNASRPCFCDNTKTWLNCRGLDLDYDEQSPLT